MLAFKAAFVEVGQLLSAMAITGALLSCVRVRKTAVTTGIGSYYYRGICEYTNNYCNVRSNINMVLIITLIQRSNYSFSINIVNQI